MSIPKLSEFALKAVVKLPTIENLPGYYKELQTVQGKTLHQIAAQLCRHANGAKWLPALDNVQTIDDFIDYTDLMRHALEHGNVGIFQYCWKIHPMEEYEAYTIINIVPVGDTQQMVIHIMKGIIAGTYAENWLKCVVKLLRSFTPAFLRLLLHYANIMVMLSYNTTPLAALITPKLELQMGIMLIEHAILTGRLKIWIKQVVRSGSVELLSWAIRAQLPINFLRLTTAVKTQKVLELFHNYIPPRIEFYYGNIFAMLKLLPSSTVSEINMALANTYIQDSAVLWEFIIHGATSLKLIAFYAAGSRDADVGKYCFEHTKILPCFALKIAREALSNPQYFEFLLSKLPLNKTKYRNPLLRELVIAANPQLLTILNKFVSTKVILSFISRVGGRSGLFWAFTKHRKFLGQRFEDILPYEAPTLEEIHSLCSSEIGSDPSYCWGLLNLIKIDDLARVLATLEQNALLGAELSMFLCTQLARSPGRILIFIKTIFQYCKMYLSEQDCKYLFHYAFMNENREFINVLVEHTGIQCYLNLLQGIKKTTPKMSIEKKKILQLCQLIH